MPAVQVRTPSGEFWTVSRRWIPHREGVGIRERLKQRTERGLDALDIPGFDADIEGIVIVLAIVAVLAIFLVFGWPLLLLGIDLVWLMLVGVFGTAFRVVLRRPWRVEATSDGERREWFVTGFRAAGRKRDELADQFRHGTNPTPPTAG